MGFNSAFKGLIWIDAMVQFTDFCLVNYSVFNPPVVVVRRHQI